MAVQRVRLALARAATAWAGRLDEIGSLSASGLPAPVGFRSSGSNTGSCSTRHGHDPAVARSRRSGSACPTSAGGRSRSRWRDSAGRAGGVQPISAIGAASGLRGRLGSDGVSSAAASSTATRPGRQHDPGGVAARPRPPRPACGHARTAAGRSARRCGRSSGMPSTAVAPKRPSTTGEMSTGSGAPPPGAGRVRPVSIRAIASASRAVALKAARSAAPPSCSRTAGSTIQRSTSGCLGEISDEARLRDSVGVGREHASAWRRRASAVELDPVDAPEHEALAGASELSSQCRCRRARPGAGRSRARRR